MGEGAREARYQFWLFTVGRLKRDVSPARAQVAMDTVAGRLAAEHEGMSGYGVYVQPLREYLAGDVGPALMLLLAAVAAVLLIACANVANLLLVRAAALVLLIAAGLLVRSFLSLQRVDPGLRSDGVLLVDLSLPRASYDKGTEVAGFYRGLEERTAGLPGVASVAAGSLVLLPELTNSGAVTVDGKPDPPVVRTAGDPLALADAVRREVHALDPDLPVARVTTLAGQLEERVAARRFHSVLLGLFSGLALLLALVGIYGVISYMVSESLPEIGIRMALGAQSRQVMAWVMGRGLVLVLLGVAVGGVAAFFVTRFLAGFLYGVTPRDPLTYGALMLLLLLVAGGATLLPARRAARTDPLEVLRSE